jgi:hypothetical protein
MEYRDLNARPKDSLRSTVDRLREDARSSKTGASGVKDLGEHGDVVWPGSDADGAPVQKSVKRFQVELDDTAARAEALAEKIRVAEAGLVAAGERLSLAREALDALDSRVDVTALQVSRGPTPPAGAPLGAQWLTPEGYLYVRVDCDEEAA